MIDRRTLLAGLSALAALPAAARAKPVATRPSALVAAARAQVGVTLRYDPAYTRLAFPGGDVPRERGVCTDVVVRAYRDAFGLDLQAILNRDMRAAFADYPHLWGLAHPDPNIDHRRVPNLQTFFRREGAQRSLADPARFEPGDLVTMLLPGDLAHIGLVSELRGELGLPLLIHNIGEGAREESVLHLYKLTGRYRWRLA